MNKKKLWKKYAKQIKIIQYKLKLHNTIEIIQYK